MARILWHGISPYRRTGYGVQTRLFAPLMRDLGHEVVICQMGQSAASDLPDFDGIPIIGPGPTAYELPRPMDLRAAFGGRNPDLIWIFKDAWVLPPRQYKAWNAACWLMTDFTDRLGLGDREFLEAFGGVPVAAAKHGLSMLRAAGFRNPGYMPCGIDTTFWTPGDKAAARDLLGLPQDVFIAGLNAQNLGTPSRKAFDEQFAGFAMFHGKHGNELLLAHTDPDAHKNPDPQSVGMDLRALAAQYGITDAVKFAASSNRMSELQMRNWYRSLDVLMNATYGEGFGVTICEALACGVPAIVTDCSAMSEKIQPGAGWLVRGQPFYVPHMQARWTVPSIHGIASALGKATRGRPVPAGYAEQWDAGRIATEYLKPLLEELTE